MTRAESARAAHEAHSAYKAARVAAYAQLRAQGKTRRQAAWRLGLGQRTSYRYEAELRGAT